MFDKIKYLCKEIPKVEWSGVLFYRAKGTITNPEEFEIHITDVLPMDMGSAAYTEYEFDQDVADYIEEDDERFEWKIGHIHSHNTMKTYFSGTDMSELNDNSEFHTYYVSLIVNNFMDLTAKVAYRASTKGFSYSANDEFGNSFIKNISKPEELLIIHDCDIEVPENEIKVSFEFSKRVEKIIAEEKARIVKSNSNKKKVSFSEDLYNFNMPDQEPTRTFEDELEDSVEVFMQLLMEKSVNKEFLSHLPKFYDWLNIIDDLELSDDKFFKQFSNNFMNLFDKEFNEFYQIVNIKDDSAKFVIKEILNELKYSEDERMKVLINFLKEKLK